MKAMGGCCCVLVLLLLLLEEALTVTGATPTPAGWLLRRSMMKEVIPSAVATRTSMAPPA
jgi:hypothetical protein